MTSGTGDMERQLSLLAYHWRASGDPALVAQYHTILTAMIDLGFTGELSADAELPDEQMPAAYLNLHEA